MPLDPNFSIDAPLIATGGDQSMPPSDVDPQQRVVRLNSSNNSAGNLNQWDGRRTWIISHGWNGNYGSFADLAANILTSNPQDILLVLDWTQASGGRNADGQGSDVGSIYDGGVFVAGSWIAPVAEVVAQQLKDWGIDPSSLNLVGHSLGTLLCSEIAWQLKNIHGLGDVGTITALDPPSAIGPRPQVPVIDPDTGEPVIDSMTGLPITVSDPRYDLGYRYRRTGESVDVGPVRFDEVSTFSRSFLGRSSVAGNAEFASWTDEAIIIDFGSGATVNPNGQHGAVYQVFNSLVNQDQTSFHLTRGLFGSKDFPGLPDYQRNPSFQNNAFAANGSGTDFEGILLAEIPDESDNFARVFGFYADAPVGSSFDRIVYGTDGADQIDSEKINDREVDRILVARGSAGGLAIGNNLYYLGKGNDEVTAGSGDDSLYGDEGNDILNGGSGTDTAFFTGNFEDYDVSVSEAAGITYTTFIHQRGTLTDGIDTLRDIEFAQFADVRIPLIGIKNGMFEDDLDHWNVEGDAKTIDQLGPISTMQGQKMAFISTAVSVSSISQSFFVPAYAQGLMFTYNVISEEPLEFVGTSYDDQFEVLLNSTIAPSQSVSIAKETVNISSWLPIDGVILSGDDNTLYQTGARTALFDLTPFRGQFVNLVFKVFDRGDEILDTAALIDNIMITFADISSPRLLNGTAGDDTLSGGIGHDTINAEGGNDTISGQTGNDELNGGDGNDTLYGGQDDDSLNGGSGIDWLVGDAGNDQLIIEDSGEGDVLSGGQGNDYYLVNFANQFVIVEKTGQGNDTIGTLVDMDLNQIQDSQGYMPEVENLMVAHPLSSSVVLRGNPLNNLITASNGHDTLDGDIGDDTLIGGAGNDTYIVDSVNDIVVEEANGGNDTIRASCNYSLMDIAEVENLVLIDYSFDGIGNTLNNTITGNARNNLLSGAAGNDHLDGRVGADTLNGGVGSDLLVGGIGDDIYVVDSTSDTVVENANEGTDIVQSSVTFTLTSLTSVENLTLTGSNAINGTGNALNNVLKGNAQANILTGNSGSDTLEGLGGSDTLRGGGGDDIYIVDSTSDLIQENANEGNDTVRSSMTFTLANLANVENLVLTGNSAINGTGNDLNNALTGNAQANRLTGGNGNDAISGNAGNDTLIGGTGNDLYIVDSTTDTIVENAAEGTDTVRSSVTFSLAALTNVENLTLIDTASNGTGNTLNNTLRGNTQNNTLNGGSGNDILEGNEGNDSLIGGSESDTLTGGLGNDSLTGNDGTDFFVLNAPGQGIDTIADFQVGQDKMRVSAAAFGGGLISGTTITANQFRAAAGATTATSAEHRFIYNSTTGALFYDADGNRTGFGTVQIATLTTKPLLSHSDIVVIA